MRTGDTAREVDASVEASVSLNRRQSGPASVSSGIKSRPASNSLSKKPEYS